MGYVQRALRRNLSTGDLLYTNARRAEFEIGEIDSDGLALLLGSGRNSVKLPWACWEGIPAMLSHKEWMKVGGTYFTDGEPDTLDEYLKGFTGVSTSRWVARALEKAGVVETDRGPPLMIRLITK